MNRLAKVVRGALALAALAAFVLLGLSFGPALLGYESFIVTSGSMGKAAPMGSVAVTRMVDVRAIRTGDVVSFQTESSSRITHRVIGVTEEQGQRAFVTKGDANPHQDPEPLRLPSGKIARVEWSVPFAGSLVRYARTPAGGVLLFGVPVLGLILDQRKRPHRHGARVSRAGVKHDFSLASSVALSCPHCGEGVALSLLPLLAQETHSINPAFPSESKGDEIVVPEVRWPEPEVVSVNVSSDGQEDLEREAKGNRDWNFPFEHRANESLSQGGGFRA